MKSQLVDTSVITSQAVNVFEISYNTESWQCLHFCTNSSGDKLEAVESPINFNANLYLSWCFELKFN